MCAVPSNRTTESNFDELIKFTEEAMQRLHVPGVSVGLFADDKEFVHGFGITSVENPLPVTPETLFMVGSITKTYTATALFRLIEAGKLNLDDRLRQFIPDFKVQDEGAAANVTVRHLLNHTAGWLGDYVFKAGRGDDNLEKYTASLGDLEQFTPLGEVFTYNNTSFNILGRLIEVVTGKTYESVIQELVLDPLNMKNSTFFPEEVMLNRFVAGHRWEEEEQKIAVVRPWGFERCENPCGGLVSNVVDQLRYARFHMGDGSTPTGERLLQPETLQLMQTPAVKGDMTWMGLNWFIWDIGGVRFIDHDGSTNGQQAALWFSPEKKLAFTALTNEQRGFLLLSELTNWVRKNFLGVEEKEPAAIVLPEAQLREYAGRYQASFGDIFDFEPVNGGLRMTHIAALHPDQTDTPDDPFPPMQTAFLGEDRFIFLDPPFKGFTFDFLRNRDGKIVWLRFSGRVMARQDTP